MRTFKDTAGREWEISVNVAAVKRVRSLINVDLMAAIGSREILERLATDDVLAVDVIYALCKPQADAGGVTDERFGEAMAGGAIKDAYDAFMEELADFFRDPAQRRVLRKVLDRQKVAEAKAQKMLEETLTDEKIDGLLNRELTRAGDSLTSALASLGSAPTT